MEVFLAKYMITLSYVSIPTNSLAYMKINIYRGTNKNKIEV